MYMKNIEQPIKITDSTSHNPLIAGCNRCKSYNTGKNALPVICYSSKNCPNPLCPLPFLYE